MGCGRGGSEYVEGMLIAVDCCSDGKGGGGERLEGEAGEEVLQRSREGEPGGRGEGSTGLGSILGSRPLILRVLRAGSVNGVGHC